MRRFASIVLAAATLVWGQQVSAQKPLDLVLILEPVEWEGAPGGRLSRVSEDLRLRPDDRLAVVELIGAPKVKAKLGEGKMKIGMRWRPTVRLGAAAVGPESEARRIYDALVMATKLLPDDYDPDRQRAILLVTADEEEGSKAKLNEVRAALQASQARVAMLAEPEPKGTRRLRQGVSVEPLVREEGGSMETLAGQEPLNEAIEKLRQ
jgi:hypothetical protein